MMFISPFMAISSELIQIIVAAIYAITLFYTIVTFQRSKRVDQITSLGDVMNELRDVDRELEKIPSGSQFGDVRNSWYIRMFNSLEWLSFMINERMITDKKLIEYTKPVIISYYEDTFLKSGSASERESSRYQQFKKLYQTMKKQV
jgi:predicted membrane protein